MTDYMRLATSDAKDTVLNFSDEILEQLMDNGEASDDLFNDYPNGDSYHHENYVAKDYSFHEAADLIEDLFEHEETDSGLWEGCDMRRQVATCAAYTYGNTVFSEWCKLIKHINCEAENIIDELDFEAEELEDDVNNLYAEADAEEGEGNYTQADHLRQEAEGTQMELDGLEDRKREALIKLINETGNKQ